MPSRAARIDDQHLVGEADAREQLADLRLGVERDDGDGEGKLFGVGATGRQAERRGTAFYRLPRPGPASTPARAADLECAMPAPRVLFVKLSSLGDVIHHLPAVSDLRARRPEVAIDWAVEEAYAPARAPAPRGRARDPRRPAAPAREPRSRRRPGARSPGRAARCASRPLRLDRRRAGAAEERGRGAGSRAGPLFGYDRREHPRARRGALLRPGPRRAARAACRRAQPPPGGRRLRLRARGPARLRPRRARRGAGLGAAAGTTSWRCTPRAAATSAGPTRAGGARGAPRARGHRHRLSRRLGAPSAPMPRASRGLAGRGRRARHGRCPRRRRSWRTPAPSSASTRGSRTSPSRSARPTVGPLRGHRARAHGPARRRRAP